MSVGGPNMLRAIRTTKGFATKPKPLFGRKAEIQIARRILISPGERGERQGIVSVPLIGWRRGGDFGLSKPAPSMRLDKKTNIYQLLIWRARRDSNS